MKIKGSRAVSTFVLALGVASCLSAQAPEEPVVIIDEIVEGEYISGEVSNLPSPQQYKVLVYVRTDKWYIHPFADQGEGKSWAAIDSRGHWTIPTKKHGFVANSVAALVVDLSVAEKAPSQVDNVLGMASHALIVYSKQELQEKGWYGNL